MHKLFLTWCFCVIIGFVSCQYYFVTAPNVLRFEHDETVVVSVFGLNNARVKVWLQYKERKFSEREVVVENEARPTVIALRVMEADIHDSESEVKIRSLKIYSEYQGTTQFREVVLSYQSGYLIVQTDKPIYTPQQTVNIRTLALEESLKPSTKKEVAMEIISPSNMTMGRISKQNEPSGFFKHEFKLPPYPELGTWTARAFYKGQFETAARSLFKVDEYVLPTFDVRVEVDAAYILPSTDIIRVTVKAKYVYGKPVDGKARLQLNLKDKLGSKNYIMDFRPLQLQPTGGRSEKVFAIETEKILKSKLLNGTAFPDGSRLEVIAWVFETATGKEEAGSNDNAMFAINPYRFHFSRSKVYFRPGWEYYLKVDVTFANGKPAENIDVSVHIVENGKLTKTQNKTTGRGGQLVASFSTDDRNDKLTFRASTDGGKVVSEDFVITPYVGKNQIQVELTQDDKSVMTMRAFTNMDLKGGHTGLLFMVVTRGKVVYTLYEDPSNSKSAFIPEKVQGYITPSARLLVFYVDKNTHELVVDSVRFDVERKCQANLTMKTESTKVKPGSGDNLILKGSPFMWVGLNVMDKALLFLNSSKNVLKKNKMFEELASHDLGCGEGSGKSSGDVFKKSGLTVLTNAVVSNDDLKRDIDTCGKIKRRKRDADDCYGAEPVCCEHGYDLADRLYHEAEDHEKLDPYTKCYAKARELALQETLPTKCIMAFFLTCRQELEKLITVVTQISSKSLSDVDGYSKDLETISESGVKAKPRTDFRESWNFDVVQLDSAGEHTHRLSYPESITEWMFQAIGITEGKGMCIADDIEVKAFQDFFIQLDLPYKAVRLEYLSLKATIFNYGKVDDKPKSANVYIEGVEGLCFNNEPNKPSEKIQLDLQPNSAQTVNFPMVPLKAGYFPIKVWAIVPDQNIVLFDVVEKKLYVVNEGIEEKISIQVCLDDPHQDREDCKNDARLISDVSSGRERTLTVDLLLPEKSISGTAKATGYLHADIMDNIVTTLVNGVDQLFRRASGCGEQTLVYLAPTVYAMWYLKQTKQVTIEIERNGIKWIRDGVNHEISQYRKADGSYAVWSHYPASTWLTAFVAKVFCQAKSVVDDVVDVKNDIEITVKWLTDRVQEDGSFVDKRPVFSRHMIGQLQEQDPSLTAFVLVSLLECAVRTPDVEKAIQKARTYIENLDRKMLKANTYILALSTYALAMTNSEKKSEFKSLLEKEANRSGRDMYWGNAGGYPASANAVETTAYGLLAMLKFNDFSSSARIVRWLTSQREARGSFRTTQDTVVGLQALSTYSVRSYSPDVDLQISFVGQNWHNAQSFSITKENALLQRIVENLPVENVDNRISVKVTGTGSGRMMIDLRYNRPAEGDDICPFIITNIEVTEVNKADPIDINIARDRKCNVCNQCNEPQVPDYYQFKNSWKPKPGGESNRGKRKRRDVNQPGAEICIQFNVSSKLDKVHGMSIVNFGLETDVKVVKEDLDKLIKDNPIIARYELPSSGKGFIVFYLDNITRVENKFIFRLMDNYQGDANTRQPSSVTVYDYYNPDQICTHIYGTGESGAKKVSFECKEDPHRCRCVQNLCAKPVFDEIERLAKSGKTDDKPGPKLVRYTCSPEKANYAVLVRIDEVKPDNSTADVTARGTVIRSIHNGVKHLTINEKIAFYWKQHCTAVEVMETNQYYIIGKDGHEFIYRNEREMRYPIMGTTLVIEDKNDNKLVDKVMSLYEKLMKTGCQA